MVEQEKPIVPRRTFLTRLWMGLGIIALLELAGSAVAFLAGGNRKKGQPSNRMIVVGGVADFQPGSVTLVRKGHCYLVRLEDGGFLALSRKCTHLGCAVSWNATRKRFECPCHGSIFDRTGNVIKSPASRALDRFKVIIAHDVVSVDISTPLRRSRFQEKQVSYPEERG